MERVTHPRPAPFVVAHRAGNDLHRLRVAETAGVRLVEADVRLFHGRLEVRHLKSVGPIPLLWDRWALASPFAARMRLRELLEAAAPDTELMLDLKGRDLRLSHLVRTELERAPRPRLTVCARSWRLLEPLRDVAGVRLVHSVGNRRQLRSLLERFETLDGVSIHKALLDEATTRLLRARAKTVMTWPVLDVEEARRLLGWGVDGLIADRFEGLSAAL